MVGYKIFGFLPTLGEDNLVFNYIIHKWEKVVIFLPSIYVDKSSMQAKIL